MKPIIREQWIKAAPPVMENYSSHFRRKIKVTTRSHQGRRGSWRNKPNLVNHDLTVAGKPVGLVTDEKLADGNLLLKVAWTDEDAMRIFDANLHKGWSIGITPTELGSDNEVLSYEPHHFSLILPGQRAVCPKGTCDAVSGFSVNEPDFVGFSIVEKGIMETTEATAPAAQVTPTEPAPEAAPAAPAPTEPAAPAAPPAQPEAVPPPAAPAAPASEAAPPCACKDKKPEAPKVAVAPVGFSEVEVFAMRDELAALKAQREKELADLNTLRQKVQAFESEKRTALIARLPKDRGIDYNAESLESLEKMARVLGVANFSEVPTPPAAPAEAETPEAPITSSGAREFNRPVADPVKEAKEKATRARIERLWASPQ